MFKAFALFLFAALMYKMGPLGWVILALCIGYGIGDGSRSRRK